MKLQIYSQNRLLLVNGRMKPYVVTFQFHFTDPKDIAAHHEDLLLQLLAWKAISLSHTSFYFRSKSSADELVATIVPLLYDKEESCVFEINTDNWKGFTRTGVVDAISLGIEPDDDDDFLPDLVKHCVSSLTLRPPKLI